MTTWQAYSSFFLICFPILVMWTNHIKAIAGKTISTVNFFLYVTFWTTILSVGLTSLYQHLSK